MPMPTLDPSPTPSEPSPALDRRAAIRYACEVQGDCQPITQLEAGNRWPARLLNVSSTGVGLLLSRRFEPGTLLAVAVEPDGNSTRCLPLARVRRVRRHGNYWLLGCVWADELSDEDMRPLVTSSAVRSALWQKVRKAIGSVETLIQRRRRPTASEGAPLLAPLLTALRARTV